MFFTRPGEPSKFPAVYLKLRFHVLVRKPFYPTFLHFADGNIPRLLVLITARRREKDDDVMTFLHPHLKPQKC